MPFILFIQFSNCFPSSTESIQSFLRWSQWKLIAMYSAVSINRVRNGVPLCSSTFRSSSDFLTVTIQRSTRSTYVRPSPSLRREGRDMYTITRGIVCRFSSFTTRRCRRLSRMMAQIMRVTPNWQWPWGRVGCGDYVTYTHMHRIDDKERTNGRERVKRMKSKKKHLLIH